MNRILTLLFALAISLHSFGQLYGVYVTADDFANNTPVKGTALQETSGAGPSNLVLKLPDGSKRTFKSGTFWGFYKPFSKKSDIITQYRSMKGDFYPIYTSGELIACFHFGSGGRHEEGEDGQSTFRYYSYYSSIYLSKGPYETAKEIDSFSELQDYMDSELFQLLGNYRNKNEDLHLAQYVEFYNELAKKAAKEREEEGKYACIYFLAAT